VANCETTSRFLGKLDHWLGQTQWAVHDLEHVQQEGIAPKHQVMVPIEKGPRWISIETYRANLEKIVERLEKTGARLVFATTTPVPAGARSRVPEDVARYSETALAVMGEHGVKIDDLNSVVVEYAYQFQKLMTLISIQKVARYLLITLRQVSNRTYPSSWPILLISPILGLSDPKGSTALSRGIVPFPI
jgi:hypothetical protein